MTEIKLENVSYAYDEQQILKDISLQVEAGQVVAILGSSGSQDIFYRRCSS